MMLNADQLAAPIVPAVAHRSRPGAAWSLIVAKCPHCGRRHLHGGGVGEQPEGGHRIAHCVAGGRVGYVLALEQRQ